MRGSSAFTEDVANVQVPSALAPPMIGIQEFGIAIALDQVESTVFHMVSVIIKALGIVHLCLLLLWIIVTSAERFVNELKRIAGQCGIRPGGGRGNPSRKRGIREKKRRK